MAGSYNHCVTNSGALRDNESFAKQIENLGDAYETVEEMYGMIWYLANRVAESYYSQVPTAKFVEEARQHYKEGIAISPGHQT